MTWDDEQNDGVVDDDESILDELHGAADTAIAAIRDRGIVALRMPPAAFSPILGPLCAPPWPLSPGTVAYAVWFDWELTVDEDEEEDEQEQAEPGAIVGVGYLPDGSSYTIAAPASLCMIDWAMIADMAPVLRFLPLGYDVFGEPDQATLALVVSVSTERAWLASRKLVDQTGAEFPTLLSGLDQP